MSFNSLILFWFGKEKRQLPWRDDSITYKIWLSEIILQQTRVAQGKDYYLRFIEEYPTLEDLAKASEQEVLKSWQGLGYYSRARNLHYTARYIYNELNGVFPDNYKDLLKLKGIGPYTAAAIASISYNEPVPAIDGNAFRVYSRYFNIDLDISKGSTRKYFFELGKEIIDKKNPGDFNQAVMELGALICLPKNPKCEICPLNESCEALRNKIIDKLPVKTGKVKVKTRYFHFLEITDGESILLKQRDENDVWRNLYTFPLIERKDESLPEFDEFDQKFTETHSETHVLTHQRLEISFWKVEIDSKDLKRLSKKTESEIYPVNQIKELPFPKPMEKYLNSKI